RRTGSQPAGQRRAATPKHSVECFKECIGRASCEFNRSDLILSKTPALPRPCPTDACFRNCHCIPAPGDARHRAAMRTFSLLRLAWDSVEFCGSTSCETTRGERK